MKTELLKSQLGKVKITEVKESLVNTAEIDFTLMKSAVLFPYEKVYINNIAFIVIAGKEDNKEIVISCKKDIFKKGEEIYIMSFCDVDVDERYTHNARTHTPRIVETNQYNKIIKKEDSKIQKLKPIIHKP